FFPKTDIYQILSLFRIIKNSTFAANKKVSYMRKLTAAIVLLAGVAGAQAQMRYDHYEPLEEDTLKRTRTIQEVELFGSKGQQPEGLEIITRMPLKTRDQIQNISVISSKVIEDLGGLTVTDVV